jgi:hypothetical protein
MHRGRENAVAQLQELDQIPVRIAPGATLRR